MFYKVISLAVILVCISAQHHEAPSYSTYAHHGDEEHQNYPQPIPTAIKPTHIVPALFKVPKATHQTASTLNEAPTAQAELKTPTNIQHTHNPHEKAGHHEEYPDAHPRYVFEYSVNDKETHDIHNQYEERDGHFVKGVYSLVQPDGVTRTVHYTADKEGFNAQVEYSGHANHPGGQKTGQVHQQKTPASVHQQQNVAHHNQQAPAQQVPSHVHQHQPISAHIHQQQTVETIPVHHQQNSPQGGAIHVQHQQAPTQIHQEQAIQTIPVYNQQVSTHAHQEVPAQVHYQQSTETIPIHHPHIPAQVQHQQAQEVVKVSAQQIPSHAHQQHALEAISVHRQQVPIQDHRQDKSVETISVHQPHIPIQVHKQVPVPVHNHQAAPAIHHQDIRSDHQQSVEAISAPVQHQEIPAAFHHHEVSTINQHVVEDNHIHHTQVILPTAPILYHHVPQVHREVITQGQHQPGPA